MTKLLLVIAIALSLASCTSEKQVAEMLKKNPDIVIDALKADPEKFLDFLEDLTQKARELQAKRQERKSKQEVEDRINNPLSPEIRADEAILGPKDAPLTLVEYSDFECPFCSRGYQTAMALKKQYGDKIRFIFKHLPLSFHKNAMPAAQYFEALRLQSVDKAFAFHNKIFENQEGLRKGEKFLQDTAKSLGANMAKLAKDIKSDAVKNRIAEDMKEAQSFEMSGTPGFIINGVPVRGAYPVTHFNMIIDELKKAGKVKL